VSSGGLWAKEVPASKEAQIAIDQGREDLEELVLAGFWYACGFLPYTAVSAKSGIREFQMKT
jgi:hypothetical protein